MRIMIIGQRALITTGRIDEHPLKTAINGGNSVSSPIQSKPKLLTGGDLLGIRAVSLRHPYIAQRGILQSDEGVSVAADLQATSIVVGEIVGKSRNLTIRIAH